MTEPQEVGLTIPLEMIYTILLIFGPFILTGIWSMVIMWFKLQTQLTRIILIENKANDIEKRHIDFQLVQTKENRELIDSMHAIKSQVNTIQTMLRLIINKKINFQDHQEKKENEGDY
jgi:hypothetical protein